MNLQRRRRRRSSYNIRPELSESGAIRLRNQYETAFGEPITLRAVKSESNLKKGKKSKKQRRKSNSNVFRNIGNSSNNILPDFPIPERFVRQSNKSPILLEPFSENSPRTQVMTNIRSQYMLPKAPSKMPKQKSSKTIKKEMKSQLKYARNDIMGNQPVTHPQNRLNPKTIKEYKNTMAFYKSRKINKLNRHLGKSLKAKQNHHKVLNQIKRGKN